MPNKELRFIEHAEFNLTAELYFQLRSRGIKTRMEVWCFTSAHGRSGGRVDIACFAMNRMVAVIEVKRPGKTDRLFGVQKAMYLELARTHGIACFVCNSYKTAPDVIETINILVIKHMRAWPIPPDL
jgi:hypothetical protein